MRSGTLSEAKRVACVLDAPKKPASSALLQASLGAALLHGVLLAAAYASSHRVNLSVARSLPDLEVELSTPLPSEPEQPLPTPPPPLAAKPTKPPPPLAAKPTKPPPTQRSAPPPSAAESANLVTAAPEPLDFGDTFVTGNAANFAGGVSANEGTSTRAVQDKNAAGKGRDPNADASRPPTLASGSHWDCPFPFEADAAGIDSALVGLRVEVAADGKVREARATTDPGHGFAREARRCALSKHWAPGLDRAGRPTTAVALVNVRFER